MVLVAFNLLVRRFALHSVPRQLIQGIESSPRITQLALGNSLMAAGFDAPVFDRYMRPPRSYAFNAGLGASSPVEHLMLLRLAIRHDPAIEQVIYGFFDFQLTEPPAIRNQDLIGNLAASYYLEPGIALKYYQMDARDRLEFRVMRLFPMLVERGTLWEKIELWRRAVGEIGMPRTMTNQFGRVHDFELLEARSSAAFARQCEESSKPAVGLQAPIAEIIRESRARGAKVVFVEMPMSPYHRETFYRLASWDRYRQKLRGLIDDAGAEYVSASDWIQNPDEFADNLHLAPAGAEDFSRHLALYLRRKRSTLPAGSLNENDRTGGPARP